MYLQFKKTRFHCNNYMEVQCLCKTQQMNCDNSNYRKYIKLKFCQLFPKITMINFLQQSDTMTIHVNKREKQCTQNSQITKSTLPENAVILETPMKTGNESLENQRNINSCQQQIVPQQNFVNIINFTH